MATTYTKSFSADFGSNLNPAQFHLEIDADPGIAPAINNVELTGDVVDITFASGLSAGEQTTLNTLITNHVPYTSPQSTVTSTGSNNTTTTIQTTQTANRTVIIPDASTTLVGESITQTLQNKKLVTANTEIVDDGDNTKKIKFDASTAGTGTELTLKGAQTGNRTITFPDVTCTVVCLTATQTLSNKKFTDSSCTFADNADDTKTLDFSLGGATTGNIMTIASNHSANRTLTLPDTTDTLVSLEATQTLTNKTMTATSNSARASDLATTGANVVIDGAAPPTTGQILTATSATAADWQTPSSGSLTYNEISAVSTIASSSTTYVVINSMSIVPSAGTYFVTFSQSMSTEIKDDLVSIALFVDETVVQHTERQLFAVSGHNHTVDLQGHCQGVVVSTGTETISARWKISANTVNGFERSMFLLKLN